MQKEKLKNKLTINWVKVILVGLKKKEQTDNLRLRISPILILHLRSNVKYSTTQQFLSI